MRNFEENRCDDNMKWNENFKSFFDANFVSGISFFDTQFWFLQKSVNYLSERKIDNSCDILMILFLSHQSLIYHLPGIQEMSVSCVFYPKPIITVNLTQYFIPGINASRHIQNVASLRFFTPTAWRQPHCTSYVERVVIAVASHGWHANDIAH